ncbi:putative histone-lysine N-methyltransferase (Ash1) [Aspergillus foveolatus]|uniref:putative histone-lysine N-methyltransferase (Ash1) n=1 Tax=Aspergillus foveolatus TaxID=210207 RepID=UPI003CCD91E2
MDGPPGLSSASPATPATISDLVKHSHEPPDHVMAFDYTEQLLTPENSRSETSSNNDNASNEEKPTVRRQSTRVTRASLRGAADLDFGAEIEHNGLKHSAEITEHVVLDKPPDNGAALRGKNPRASHLRHSIAIMESALQAETSLTQDPMDVDNYPLAPNTPISESSHGSHTDDVPAALPPRTLRKRVEQALARDKGYGSKKGSKPASADNEIPVRRSSRLSLLGKVSDLAGRATGVLGKRSTSMRGNEKEPDRRSSLRTRRPTTAREEPATEPPAKKQRVSVSAPVDKAKSESDASQEEPTPSEVITRFKEKRWLTHGLYSGQEYTNLRPSQKRTEKRRKSHNTSQPNHQRKYLPLPMFAGERLLQTGRDFQLPFDIYSPLPPGQPKPNEWRKTNKNVFVGEAGSIWRANKEEELSKCTCTPETGCDQFCQNRYMFYECDDRICGVGPECGNRNFEELKQRAKAGGKYNVGVEVIKTPDRGYGVRSNRTFEPNQIIVEYTGEIITQAECEKRMRTIYKKNECYYLMYFDQNMIIDATRGSIARFVNHGCEPNCRMEKWTVAGKPRMALFAGDRGIMTGEELTYDYNFDPYSQKNVQQCRCGSSQCRGILGPRKREKEQRAELRAAKLKEIADAKKAKAAKRRKENALNRSHPRNNRKGRALTPSSIKSGVKKAASKARVAVSKAAVSRKKPAAATSSKKSASKKSTNASKQTSTKSKRNIKLPTIKATKVKAKITSRVRAPAQTTRTKTKKASTSPPKSRSRVSATKTTKAVTAAESSPARKRPSKAKKDILKGFRETINKGTTNQSPRPKSSSTRTTERSRTTGRSPRARK